MNIQAEIVRRRSATFDATLVYFDEPQVVTLISQKTRVVAVAVPDDDPAVSKFLATTATDKDWNKYLAGTVDLKYLFTFPKVRVQYSFDLQTMKENKVMMTPWVGEVDERFLPMPRFFSTNHTEEYKVDERATDTETLLIDGEWELTDFGQFQQKYADLYAFIVATDTWKSPTATLAEKQRVKGAFLDRPFRGGFSYVHLFKDLNDNVPRSEQLNLSKIKYASPGEVEIFGKVGVFGDLHKIIPNFLLKRHEISELYRVFHQYLSENHYFQIEGKQYPKDDPTEKYMKAQARNLANEMHAPDFNAVWSLTNENALVAAKIVLSFYRRLNDAATYFAQGRIAYEN